MMRIRNCQTSMISYTVSKQIKLSKNKVQMYMDFMFAPTKKPLKAWEPLEDAWHPKTCLTTTKM